MEKWKALEAGGNPAELVAHLVVTATCDRDGNRVFTAEDYEAVQTKAASALDRLSNATLKVNGLAPDSLADAKNA